MSLDQPTLYHHHGRFRIAGGTLPDAITAYRTYGDAKNPCIVSPTFFGGKLDSLSFLVGEDKALDTKKYFVVTFALFSGGESSSPSNTPSPYDGPYFPAVSYEDNVRAHHAVLQELGIKKIFTVVGYSMGAQMAYYWAVMYPDYAERFVSICGAARTSPHNKCFLEGPKIALTASKDFEYGHYKYEPQHGIRAFARAFSAWPYSQAWFRGNMYKYGGKYPDLSTFIREEWEGRFLAAWDANDLLTLVRTWQTGDVAFIRDGGDLKKCLRAIKARGLIMPCKTDLYFTPEDSENEVRDMPNTSRLVLIDSIWGHEAGGGSNATDIEFIAGEITKFLDECTPPTGLLSKLSFY